MSVGDAPVAPKTAPRTKRNALIAVTLIIALLAIGGSFVGGRTVGHSKVPGLERRVASLQRSVKAGDAKLRARSESNAANAAKAQELQAKLDTEHENSNMCRTSVDDADKAFTSLGNLLSVVFSTTDPAILDPYMNHLFDDMDQYHAVRGLCTNTMTQT